jgi:hypothetical protein
MGDFRAREIHLATGVCQRISLKRGAVILVRRGRVVVRPRMEWLAECVVTTEIHLDAEETYLADSAGDLDLMATTSADVAVIPSPPFRCLRWSWWRQLICRRLPLAAR